MKKFHWGPFAAFALFMPMLLALWPAGCSNNPGQKAQSAEHVAPDSLIAQERGEWTLLPHPAFAYADAARSGSVSIADIAERVLPSVVSISSSRVVKNPHADDPMFRFFFGPMPPGDRREQGLGSGVVVSGDGIVLTNNHVVANADEVKITTSDNREFEAEIVGTDDKSDLAVLRLKGDVKGLKPLTLGDSSRLRLGDVVLAVGNPFGIGQTVTMGIVSAKDRTDLGIVDYENFIQTDAAINPGNSGGALINMAGELVGINTAIYSRSGGNMGIGFAIPSNQAKPIADSLLQHGKVVRGWLGVGIQDLNADLAQALGIPTTSGVVITDVGKDGPAAKAGVQRGDVVVRVNGQAVDTTGKLRNAIAGAGASKVKLEIIRGGKALQLDIQLGEAPGAKVASDNDKRGHQDGIAVEPLNDAHRRKLGIGSEVSAGVVITRVDPSSAAARAGLRPGDVVLEVERKAVRSADEFKRAYDQAKDRALLLVYRGGGTVFVVVKKK